MPYPDVETAVMDLLADLGQTYETLRPKFEANLPAVHVYVVGGTDDGLSDAARIVVDVYGPNRNEAWQVAEAVRDRLGDPKDPALKTALRAAGIDRAQTDIRPRRVPYADTAVRLVTATYRITTRRAAA